MTSYSNQICFVGEPEPIDVVGARVDPLAEFLRRLGKAHASCHDGVNENFRPVDRQNAVDILHGIMKDLHID